MIALEFVADRAKTPDAPAVARIVEVAREDGLLLLPTGSYGNVIRLLPPLTLSDAEFAEGMERLERAIRSVYELQSTQA